MAVEFEGFSIREYVSKVRNVDVGRCWPFGSEDQVKKMEMKEVNVLDFLPPITVTKFRWWSHELDQLPRSNDDDVRENIDKDSGNFEEGEELDREDCTAAAVDGSSDGGCLGSVAAGKKGIKKAKAPKKRSIVEIFAVAPPVCKVGEGELKKVKRKSKLKKRISKKNVSIPIKEKLHKLKQQTAVNFNGILYSSSFNKRFSDDSLDAVSIRKKKSILKCVSTKKKHKVVRTSKLIGKHQKPVIPVRGILKNQTKVASGKTSSRICDMQRNSDANPCSIQLSERHVRFSGKDDILGPKRKHVSSLEGLELQSRSNSTLDDVAASSAKESCLKSNRDLAVLEVNGSDEDVSLAVLEVNGSDEDVSFGSENIFEVQPLNESDSWDYDDTPNFPRPQISCQEKVENLSYKLVSPNQIGVNSDNLPMFEGSPTISEKTSHAKTSRLLLNERYNSIINYHDSTGSRDSNTSERMIDHVGYPTHDVAATTSTAYMKTLAQPSSSCLATNVLTNKRIPSLPQTTTEIFDGPPQYQPFSHLSHKELMGSICSLPKQKAAMCGGKSMDEDFFGLPLNSQGELIQLTSRGKGGFNQLKNATTLVGSSSNLPMYNYAFPEGTGNCLNVNERHCVDRTVQKNHLKLLPLHNFVKENLNGHASCRFGVTESQGIRNTDKQWPDCERGSNHSVCPWESDMSLMNISFHGGRQYDPFQNQVGTGQVKLHESPNQMLSHITQPTMRLMGKDVTVGSSSNDSHGYENGKVWTDKEIITEHCPISTVTDNSINGHFHSDWALHSPMGKSKDPVPHSFDIRSSQLQSLLQAQAPDFRVLHSHPHPSWQTNMLSQNSSFATNGNPSSTLHSFAHRPISPTLFNRAPNLISVTGSSKFRSQVPIPPSVPYNTCQHMHLDSAELNYKQSLPQATKSAFEFPFLHPDCREHSEPSWFQETSKSLPPWLLHAAQEKETVSASSQPCFDAIAKYHSSTNGANFPSIPFVHHAPVVSYPYNLMTSHPHMQSSLASTSLAHPSLMPILPGYKPTSAINIRTKCKLKDRMKSTPFPVRNLDIPYKTRKRLAIKLDESRRRTKIPNIGMQEDFCALTGSKVTGNSEKQCNAGAFELSSNTDGTSTVRYDLKGTPKDSLGNSFGIDYSKLDGMMRSGPHKLSAGAKHILKPSQSIDQDNSRLTHSTIPFPASTSSGRIPEPQKSAKIYRF